MTYHVTMSASDDCLLESEVRRKNWLPGWNQGLHLRELFGWFLGNFEAENGPRRCCGERSAYKEHQKWPETEFLRQKRTKGKLNVKTSETQRKRPKNDLLVALAAAIRDRQNSRSNRSWAAQISFVFSRLPFKKEAQGSGLMAVDPESRR